MLNLPSVFDLSCLLVAVVQNRATDLESKITLNQEPSAAA